MQQRKVNATTCGTAWKDKPWLPILCSLVLTGMTGWGATRYVSPNGCDTASGTREAPLQTLRAAVTQAGAGDTILLHCGVYPVTNTLVIDKRGVVVRGQGRSPRDVVLDGRAAGSCLQINGGAALHTLTLSNFVRRVANQAGALWLQDGVLSNCVATCNRSTHAHARGGALYLTHTDALLVDSEISRNVSHGRGGGVFIDVAGATLRGCEVVDNVASNRGGGVFAFTGKMEGCLIQGNRGGDGGGAAGRFEQGIVRCRVIANQARQGGGLLLDYAAPGASNTVVDTLFSNNLARTYGGAIHITAPRSHTMIRGSQLVLNTATDPLAQSGGGGGGISVYRAGAREIQRVVIEDSFFDRNRAQAKGGGLFIGTPSCEAWVTQTRFSGNRARGVAPQWGGGMALLGAAHVSGCVVTGNHAGMAGGGIMLDATQQTRLEKTRVSRNTTATGVDQDVHRNRAVDAQPLKRSVIWEAFNRASPDLQPIGRLAPRHAREIGDSPWSIGCETLDRDYGDFSKYRSYVGELGVKHARLQSGWAKTEKRKGVYDFAWLDTIVDGLKEQGVEPWICLCYGNPLYKSQTDLGAGIFTAEATLVGWSNYVAATVAHYRDRVTEWEIWNEPSHRADPAAYANLMITASRAIRCVQPAATIMGFTIHGSFSGGGLAFPRAVFDVLKQRNELDGIHAVTYHPYTRNPDSIYASLHEMTDLLKAYNPKLTLYQGESGCPSILEWGHALNTYPWTEYSQAKWVLRRMAGDWARGIRTSVFTMADLNYGFMLQSFGMLRADLNHNIIYKRPAFYGVQHMAAFFDNQVPPTGLVAVEGGNGRSLEAAGFRKAGTQAVLIWQNDRVPTDAVAWEPCDLTLRGVAFADPVYVEMITGRVYELKAGSWSAAAGNIAFKQLPLWDSPVLLAERGQVPLQ